MGLKSFTNNQFVCKHRIQKVSGVWMCIKCNQHYTPAEIAVLATIGANAERMCKQCEEYDRGTHLCGTCGNSLQLVRPGKYQCVHCESVKGR